MANQRDIVFDIMKGIGILSVLVGHWPGINEAVKTFIYSFHMPLFFLLSGYFTKTAFSLQGIKKSAQRLVIPFLFTQLLIIGWYIVYCFAKSDFTLLIRSVLSLVWGSGDIIKSRFGDIFVGPLWFLTALFFGKALFQLFMLNSTKWKLLLFSLVASVGAIYLHKVTMSPWSLLQGVGALIFIAIGWFAKNVSIPKFLYIVLMGCWFFALAFSSMSMYGCDYKCFPLDVLGACGGTIVIWGLSKYLAKIPILSSVLAWCGCYSLVILCFHSFDWFSSLAWTIRGHLPFSIGENTFTLFRYCLTIFFSWIAIKTPYIRELLGVSTTSLLSMRISKAHGTL